MSEPINQQSPEWVLSEIKTTLDMHVKAAGEHRAAQVAMFERLNARVTSLEGDRKKLFGFAAGAGLGAGGLATGFWKLFGGGSGH